MAHLCLCVVCEIVAFFINMHVSNEYLLHFLALRTLSCFHLLLIYDKDNECTQHTDFTWKSVLGMSHAHTAHTDRSGALMHNTSLHCVANVNASHEYVMSFSDCGTFQAWTCNSFLYCPYMLSSGQIYTSFRSSCINFISLGWYCSSLKKKRNIF